MVRWLARPASARRRTEAGIAPAIAIVAGGIVVGIFTGMIWGPVQEAVKALAAIADVVVGQLPDAADLGLDASGGWIKAYGLLNTFLPITEALAFIGLLVGVILAGFAFRVAVVIYHLIPKPGVGT